MAETRTRFAPSPTGNMHIGSLRTAAYAYALAKHDHGEFLLRIEDTDQKREVKDSTEKIYEILKKFELNWDEEPIIQSQRVLQGVYKEAAQKLVQSGNAYEHEGAVRLKVPKDETISFHDFVINKDISWNSNDVPDAVLLKSDGFPTYHLASIVDDHESKISHVIRSSEWIPSTPLHVLLYRYLGFEMPQIGHPTAILDPAGGKLSKRKDNVSVEQFLDEGYLPEALLNFVILLGWAPKDNRELFTLAEFVEAFDPAGFQKSNPVMNTQKLDWFNGHCIRQKSDKELSDLIKPFSKYHLSLPMIKLIKERITKLNEVDNLVKFFFERPAPQKNLDKSFLTTAAEAIEKGLDLAEMAKSKNWKLGDFFMNLRLAICGQKITPPLTESIAILGKTETLARIKQNL